MVLHGASCGSSEGFLKTQTLLVVSLVVNHLFANLLFLLFISLINQWPQDLLHNIVRELNRRCRLNDLRGRADWIADRRGDEGNLNQQSGLNGLYTQR